MNYSTELFTVTEPDKQIETLDQETIEHPIFEKYTEFTLEATKKLTKQLEGIEYNKDKIALFDEFYRTSHIICNFSKILKIHKTYQLAAILEMIIDFIRELKTTSKYSIDYLTKIIIKEIENVTRSFLNEKKATQDISSLKEECKTYLQKPMSEWLENFSYQEVEEEVVIPQATPMETVEEPTIPETTATMAEETQPDTQEEEISHAEEDGPEELEIPASKIGLISDFYEEATENLTQIASQVLELESNPQAKDILNHLFRSFHTLKGGARLLNIQKMEKLCHAIENLLDKCRSGELQINERLIDIILEGHKILLEMIEEVASKGPIYSRIMPAIAKIANFDKPETEKSLPVQTQHSETRQEDAVSSSESKSEEKQQINRPEPKKAEVQGKPVESAAVKKSFSRQMNVIRVSTEKLDTVINISSELPIARIRFRDQISFLSKLYRDLKKIGDRANENEPVIFLNRLKVANEVLVKELSDLFNASDSQVEKVEILSKRFYHELTNEVYRSELTVTEEMTLLQIAFNELKQNVTKNVENLETLTTKLQNSVMNFRMVPISSLLEKFPTQTRDMAKQTGKLVTMKIKGGETELDKVMITKLVDPILHILRNSIDHGIETPEQRKESGKPQSGTIDLKAFYQGSNVVIQISDDGKGLDTERIKNKALEKELLTKEKLDTLSESEIFELLFLPGFSTAQKVTEISGRGVGMDVVKATINEIQGSIELASKKGKGTTISLKIPLTLAAVRVLLLDIGSQQIAFPMSNIDEVLTVSRHELKQVGKQVIYHLRDHVLPVVHLASILEIHHSFYLPDSIPLVILGEGSNRIGVIVDKLLGRHEIVIKNLGSLLQKAPFIMGCTILSDNKLVLILNTREIIEAGKEKLAIEDVQISKSSKQREHKILIVDDSAVYRQHMNSILSRSGYVVEEAENGYEALQQVTLKNYSLLCVDIVMPLMDGFELTRRLRNLPLYRNVPIILITSRTSQEDKNIAFKLGAHEYFEKPIDADVLLNSIHQHLDDGGKDES